MSTFQVTERTDKTRLTINANHVIAVLEEESGSVIVVSGDIYYNVTESYRSVRGYLKKALGDSKPAKDKSVE